MNRVQRKLETHAYLRELFRDQGKIGSVYDSNVTSFDPFPYPAQRDRAMNEYQLALQTEDNTLDALSKAEQLLQKPYEWPRTQ